MSTKSKVWIWVSGVAFLALAPFAESATNEPKVGEKAPPLTLEKLLQAPSDARANWESLRGKVVILEFWATWCGPCIAAMPHLNEVADHFKGQAVQFIAITDEKEAVVGPFLKRKPIHAWVGLDSDESMFKAYAVEGIPHTVVVDPKGNIAAITDPSTLTVQHIEDLLAGKPLALADAAKEAGLRPGGLPGASEEKEPLLQVLVRPSEAEHARSASGNGSMSLLGTDVLNALSTAYRINPVRILTNGVLPGGRFDFVIKTPAQEQDAAKSWLRQAVESTFGLSAQRERREMEVYVLTAKNPTAEGLAPTVSTGGSSSNFRPGRIQVVNGTLSSLAWSLESLLKKPVIDETGLAKRYDLEMKWVAEDTGVEAIVKAAREQLGLDLTPAKRMVEVLVVEKLRN